MFDLRRVSRGKYKGKTAVVHGNWHDLLGLEVTDTTLSNPLVQRCVSRSRKYMTHVTDGMMVLAQINGFPEILNQVELSEYLVVLERPEARNKTQLFETLNIWDRPVLSCVPEKLENKNGIWVVTFNFWITDEPSNRIIRIAPSRQVKCGLDKQDLYKKAQLEYVQGSLKNLETKYWRWLQESHGDRAKNAGGVF